MGSGSAGVLLSSLLQMHIGMTGICIIGRCLRTCLGMPPGLLPLAIVFLMRIRGCVCLLHPQVKMHAFEAALPSFPRIVEQALAAVTCNVFFQIAMNEGFAGLQWKFAGLQLGKALPMFGFP